MIHNEADAICERFRAMEGVRMVTRGWPKRPEERPCSAVHKAADAPAAFYGDREHIAQLEYYVRIFADRAAQADALASAADEVMEAMGYTRTFSYDDDSQGVRVDALRYSKYV